MAKPRRRKATLHSAGRVTEADLLERARALAEDPSLATPVCEGGCVLLSPVAAARRAIPRVHAARDDEKALQRLASRGNDLARAYAATLLVARSGKVPFVADLRVGGETIPYVIRGKAKPFFLAGLQNHHDRALRLLAFAPWAKKRKMHFFSADRGVVCTGRQARPPVDFVEEEAALLGLERKGDAFVCEHGGAASGRDSIVVRWRAAGVRLERCEECAEDEGSTVGELKRHMAGPRLSTQFEADVSLAPFRGVPLDVDAPLPAETARKYVEGALGDAALLEAARQARVDALRASGRRAYVAGDTSHGDDADAFLASLAPNASEEQALRAALAEHEGAVVLERASTSRALAELWPQHGLRMLAAVGGEEAARRLHKESVRPEEATDLVRRAAKEGATRAGLWGLPAYGPLPKAAAVADAVSRAYRASGADAAARIALDRAGQGEVAGVVLALLEALGAAKGQEWRFGTTDRELATTLAPLVARLLRAPAAEYHDALVQVARATGETAEFAPR